MNSNLIKFIIVITIVLIIIFLVYIYYEVSYLKKVVGPLDTSLLKIQQQLNKTNGIDGESYLYTLTEGPSLTDKFLKNTISHQDKIVPIVNYSNNLTNIEQDLEKTKEEFIINETDNIEDNKDKKTESLSNLKLKDLKIKAKDLGINYSTDIKKVDLVKLIKNVKEKNN